MAVKKKESEESTRRRNARNRERHANLHKRAADGDEDAKAKLQSKNAAWKARAARAMTRVASGDPQAIEAYQRRLRKKREREKVSRLRTEDPGVSDATNSGGRDDTLASNAEAAESTAEDVDEWNSGLLFNAFRPREAHESTQQQDPPTHVPAGTRSTASSPCQSDWESSEDEELEQDDVEEQLQSRVRALCLEIDGMRSERSRIRLRAEKAGAKLELVLRATMVIQQ